MSQPRPNTMVYVPPALWRQVKHLAKSHDVPLPQAVREALMDWIKKFK